MNLIDWVREFRGVTEGYVKFKPDLTGLPGGKVRFYNGLEELPFFFAPDNNRFSLLTQNLDWHNL